MFKNMNERVKANTRNLKTVIVTTAVVGGVVTLVYATKRNNELKTLLGAAGMVIKDQGGDPAVLIVQKMMEFSSK